MLPCFEARPFRIAFVVQWRVTTADECATQMLFAAVNRLDGRCDYWQTSWRKDESNLRVSCGAVLPMSFLWFLECKDDFEVARPCHFTVYCASWRILSWHVKVHKLLVMTLIIVQLLVKRQYNLTTNKTMEQNTHYPFILSVYLLCIKSTEKLRCTNSPHIRL